MAKETLSIRTHKKTRRPRGEDEQRGMHQPGQAAGLSGLQRQIGNRATERAIERGHLEGEISLRDLSLPQIQQAAVQRMLVQRQDDGGDEAVVALDTPGLTQTGQVSIEDPQIEEYEVTGKTLADVGGQLDPEEWGRCRWTVDYDYDAANGKATKVNITLHLKIRMPRWGAGYDGASPAARQEWQRMLTALRKHEDGHADIARKWAPIFKDRMLGQPEGSLKGKYQKALDDLNKEEKKFDDDTTHGQTQGVSLDTTIQ